MCWPGANFPCFLVTHPNFVLSVSRYPHQYQEHNLIGQSQACEQAPVACDWLTDGHATCPWPMGKQTMVQVKANQMKKPRGEKNSTSRTRWSLSKVDTCLLVHFPSFRGERIEPEGLEDPVTTCQTTNESHSLGGSGRNSH